MGAKRDNWDYFTQLEKDRRRDAVLNDRNALDTELDTGIIGKKQERTQGLAVELGAKEEALQNMKEYQDCLAERDKIKKEIEQEYISLRLLEVKCQELD